MPQFYPQSQSEWSILYKTIYEPLFYCDSSRIIKCFQYKVILICIWVKLLFWLSKLLCGFGQDMSNNQTFLLHISVSEALIFPIFFITRAAINKIKETLAEILLRKVFFSDLNEHCWGKRALTCMPSIFRFIIFWFLIILCNGSVHYSVSPHEHCKKCSPREMSVKEYNLKQQTCTLDSASACRLFILYLQMIEGLQLIAYVMW